MPKPLPTNEAKVTAAVITYDAGSQRVTATGMHGVPFASPVRTGATGP
jgi:hypothetical protein